MKNFLSKIWKVIEHNRYTILAMFACGVLVAGCTILQPRAPSPLDGKLVNRWQLEAQRAEFNAKFLAAEKMIGAQDQMWTSVIDFATQAAMAVPGPWGGLLGAIPTIAALGLGFDNRRKNSVITTLKATKGKKK
jgi:hypothetical protein